MSLTIGSSGSLDELIASMLARISGTTSAPAAASAPAPSKSARPVSPSATSNTVTGSGKASYSNEIMRLFTQMHQSAGTGGGSTPNSTTTTIASASTLATPIESILSSIDTDGAATGSSAANPGTPDDASDAMPWSAHMRALRPDV